MNIDTAEPRFSDDIEALYEQEAETRADNKRRGIVIQHRSWPLSDIFRSDDDHHSNCLSPLDMRRTFSDKDRHPFQSTCFETTCRASIFSTTNAVHVFSRRISSYCAAPRAEENCSYGKRQYLHGRVG